MVNYAAPTKIAQLICRVCIPLRSRATRARGSKPSNEEGVAPCHSHAWSVVQAQNLSLLLRACSSYNTGLPGIISNTHPALFEQQSSCHTTLLYGQRLLRTVLYCMQGCCPGVLQQYGLQRTTYYRSTPVVVLRI